MTTITAPRPTERLASIGVELPTTVGSNVTMHDGIARTGAIAPTGATTGRVGRAGGYAEQAIPVVTATDLARTATIDALATVADAAGGLDQVARVLHVTAHVAVDAKTFDYGTVLDEALVLVDDVFGIDHHPAVTIHGVVSLPGNAPVAIELTAVTHQA
jgi:hypothetical protein